MFGGKVGNNTLNDVWRFDLQNSTWYQLVSHEDWPSERYDFGYASFGGRLAIIGGAGLCLCLRLLINIDSSGNLNNELWQLVLNDDCFSRSTCEFCVVGSTGCGWCNNNEEGFKVCA